MTLAAVTVLFVILTLEFGSWNNQQTTRSLQDHHQTSIYPPPTIGDRSDKNCRKVCIRFTPIG